MSFPSAVNKFFHCLGRRACFLLLWDQGDFRLPRSVGICWEEDEEDDEEEEEATTNKTDRKWIHDDDEEDEVFDDDEEEDDVDCDEDVWLRRKARINGFCSVSISISMCLTLPN